MGGVGGGSGFPVPAERAIHFNCVPDIQICLLFRGPLIKTFVCFKNIYFFLFQACTSHRWDGNLS